MNYNELKTSIAEVIRTNGNEEITGEVMQYILLEMVSSLGKDFQFAGVGTPSTQVDEPDENKAWILGAGHYTNFGAQFDVAENQIAVAMYNGSFDVRFISVGRPVDDSITENGQNPVEGGAIYVTAVGGEPVVTVNGETKEVVDFIQEVYATRISVSKLLPGTDAVIELGGEDAKILFFTNGVEVRMNGSCAGGTGAFIDQMASLLNVTPTDMNTLAESHEKIYSIASRCGVFAKSDIQPLLNQGARKNDIAASIFTAVVNQTVAGLSQGRKIEGNVVYLGGPLYFLSQLREAFDKGLGTKGVCPENGLYFVYRGRRVPRGGD